VVHAAQVDLFVNYDCDLQAANLFERTVRGLARVVRMGDPGPGMLHMAGPVVNVNAAARPRPHVLAADVALAVVRALDAWAEPLKASHPSPSLEVSRLCCPCLYRYRFIFGCPLPADSGAGLAAAVHCLRQCRIGYAILSQSVWVGPPMNVQTGIPLHLTVCAFDGAFWLFSSARSHSCSVKH
jgi:hypothetical protein